jgi:hypothetical protein
VPLNFRIRDYPSGTLLNEIYTGWRWPHVVDKVEHRPLDYPKIWRIAQAKTRKPVKFGTCCSQAMAIFLDIHTAHYKDKRQLIWDTLRYPPMPYGPTLVIQGAVWGLCISFGSPLQHGFD